MKITRPGTFASVQDLGRVSYAKYGVPKSGVIDKKAAQKVNKILGNESGDAVLEWTQIGPELKFTLPTQIAISETAQNTTLNGKAIRAREVVDIPANSVLSLGNNPNVVYAYLAIKGGFQSDPILDSRSMQKGITKTGSLRGMSQLFYSSKKQKTSFFTKPSFTLHQNFKDTLARAIDCYQGPEYQLLDEGQKTALATYFTLSNQRNRMGMQVNEPVVNHLPSMLSVPIMPGTVQLTPSGKLIVLCKDCQTTGGYPRILHLPEKALAQLSQTPHNVRFRFNIIDYNE